MTREIVRTLKFRAWDGEHKEMVQAINWFIEIDDGTVWENINVCGEDDLHERYVKLMQFTGLLDKHGKEIYEGDKVKYSNAFESGIAEVRAIFETSNLAFWWTEQETDSPSLYSHCDYFGHAEDLQVIGNIYEDAGLLTN